MNTEYIFYKEFIITKKNLNIKHYMVLNLCCCVNTCTEITIKICNTISERKKGMQIKLLFFVLVSHSFVYTRKIGM